MLLLAPAWLQHACAIPLRHKVFSFASRLRCDRTVHLLSLRHLSTLFPTRYRQVKLYFPSNDCSEQVERKSSKSLLCLQWLALLSHKVQGEGATWLRRETDGDWWNWWNWWNWEQPDKKPGSREWWQNGEGEAGETGFRDEFALAYGEHSGIWWRAMWRRVTKYCMWLFRKKDNI